MLNFVSRGSKIGAQNVFRIKDLGVEKASGGFNGFYSSFIIYK